MGKDGFLTPKAIANRMKAKGLQKLRWYCEMCQKQCRDDNGFKCHLMSESHNRQIQLFVDNPNKYLDGFSSQFENEFMKLLRRRYGTKRVAANQVYQEYISDKQHLHMNSTRWPTLTDFVKHLGKESLCEVNETEKGWFITYIDRDPEVLARAEASARKERLAKDEEERERIELERQIERANQQAASAASTASAAAPATPAVAELKKAEGEQVQFVLPKITLEAPVLVKPANALAALAAKAAAPAKDAAGSADTGDKRKRSAMEEIMALEEAKKAKNNRRDYWLDADIVVKIRNKKLADGKYDGKKGVVLKVIDKYTGEIEMLDSGDVIRVDQAHCETVLPTFGGHVRIVNGAYRGEKAVLLGINAADFNATVRIVQGPYNERVVEKVPYEDICKLAS